MRIDDQHVERSEERGRQARCAGAALRMTRAPRRCARDAIACTAAMGTSSCSSSVLPGTSAASGTCCRVRRAFAPATTVMAFWPASSTWISATPVGFRDAPHPADVDAGRDESGQRVAGEDVGADRARHGDVGAGTTRGQRLIGAFAAGQRGEGAAGDRLAGLRKARDARDEIEIDRAEDDDHPPLTPPCVRPATISFWMKIVSSSTGSVTMIAAAASGPQASCSNVSTL